MFCRICLWMIIGLTGSIAVAQSIKLDTYKYGEGLRLNNDSDYSMRISGFVQPFAEVKEYTGNNEQDLETRFRMRRIRLRLDGDLGSERFNYRFAVDLSGSGEVDEEVSNYLLDATISYDITKRIKATFGQRATYTDNRELFMASNSLQLVERSRLTSAFASIREFGLFVQGRFKTGNMGYVKPYFVLTNGDGQNVFNKDRGGLKVGGRIDYLPFGLFTNFGQFRQADIMRENIPKLVIGANLSHNDGMSSRRGRESGSIIYLNENDEESLPSFTKYGVDFLLKYKGFSAIGEYVKTTSTVPDDITQRVRNDGSTSMNFEVNGVQDVVGYVRGRMMLGDAFNFQAGYLFKNGYSIDGRYTHLRADDNSFLNNGAFYDRPNYYTLGISKYISRDYGAKIQTSWTYVDGGDGITDNNGDALPGNEWIARLMLTVTF